MLYTGPNTLPVWDSTCNQPTKGPFRDPSAYLETIMSKQGSKPTQATRQVFVALGFDEERKPRGARFIDPNVDVLTKAVAAMGLNLYELKSPELIEAVESLPAGRLLSTGRGLVPNIRQVLYSDIVFEIAGEDAVLRGKTDDALPVVKGLPEKWDAIDAGHLVIAEEYPQYGWFEAIVTNRTDELLTLRYRDYSKLPKFYRHVRAVALLSQPVA